MASRSHQFWFVAETLYQQELRARRELGQQGYEAEYPMYRMPWKAGERRIKPLFEGYIFIRESARWRSICGTRGIKRLLMNGETPSRVLDSDLQLFRDCEDELGYFVEPSAKSVRPGDRASPRSGRFARVEGEVLCFQGARRVELLYWMLGRAVRYSHPIADLDVA